jgi:hypothetical protein
MDGFSGSRVRALGIPAAACIALAASGLAQGPQLSLTDVTQASGVDWVQIENNTTMGAGAAFLDFDGDGWEDILLVGGDSEPGLYRSTQQGARFVRVQPSPLRGSVAMETMCVTVGDIDNDGDPDVFIGRYGPNQLFRNDGGGAFTEITTPLIAGGRYDWTATAAFGDADGDGHLDLYIGNYISPISSFPNHTPVPNLLLRGAGNGTFANVTSPVVAGAGTALATAWSDYDGDGDVDILVGNDFGSTVEANQLYRNDGPAPGGLAFSNVSAATGFDVSIYCMGIAIGDYDRDGDLDSYFTNMGRNAFLRNDGSSFTDVADATGTDLTHDLDAGAPVLATSWGTGFHDFDSDGWLDLYVSNGFITSDPSLPNGLFVRDVLFRHDGPSLTYTRMSQPLSNAIGRGAAFADYDRDGDVDILQVNVMGPPVLWRNDSPRRGRFLTATLEGTVSNRDAIGARVTVDTGSFSAVREVRRSDSFESSSSRNLHFGLGVGARGQRVHVRWPSGIEQTRLDVPLDRHMSLREPSVTVLGAASATRSVPQGKLLEFRATLRNHLSATEIGAYVPQLRTAAGDLVWMGPIRVVTLLPSEDRAILETLLVPSAVGDPGQFGLRLVWAAADAAISLSEAEAPVR